MSARWVAPALAIVLAGCAGPPGAPDLPGAAGSREPDLACALPSNCVSSRGGSGLVPLAYAGTAADATDRLQATLRTFPEASVVRREPLALAVIFTTPAGFRDRVDFRIDPEAQRVDFRSRSLLGLFDWGKNRSRMQEFASRFDRLGRP